MRRGQIIEMGAQFYASRFIQPQADDGFRNESPFARAIEQIIQMAQNS